MSMQASGTSTHRTMESAKTSPQQVIRVRRDGSIVCLHDEKLELDRLGKRQVRRASHVEFDEDRQQWVARVAATGEEIHASASRQECLAAEAHFFNQRLRQGLRPFQV